jgi:hypothetical protein
MYFLVEGSSRKRATAMRYSVIVARRSLPLCTRIRFDLPEETGTDRSPD